MILFAPAYDEPTRCTFRLASVFVDASTQPLLREDANRRNLQAALVRSATPLVAFAHGSPEYLKGHDDEPVLTLQDVRRLPARAVLAYACHTGTKLGRAMSRTGGAWWGYSGAVAAPPEEATETGLIAPVFKFLVDSFLHAEGEIPAQSFFERLKQSCDRAGHGFDELYEAGEIMDAGVYLCLLHVWDRLRVWSAGAAGPAHHPDVKSDIFILG